MRPEVFVYTAPEQWTPAPPEVHDWFAAGWAGDALEARGYACLSLSRAPSPLVGSAVRWVARAPEALYRHALLVQAAACDTVVLCPTTPDLLAYLARHGTMAHVAQVASDVEDMCGMLERLFLAWHGHVQETACSSCDPVPGKVDAIRRRSRNGSPPAMIMQPSGKKRGQG